MVTTVSQWVYDMVINTRGICSHIGIITFPLVHSHLKTKIIIFVQRIQHLHYQSIHCKRKRWERTELIDGPQNQYLCNSTRQTQLLPKCGHNSTFEIKSKSHQHLNSHPIHPSMKKSFILGHLSQVNEVTKPTTDNEENII